MRRGVANASRTASSSSLTMPKRGARAQDVEIIGDLGGELVQAPRRSRRGRARSAAAAAAREWHGPALRQAEVPFSSSAWRGSAMSAISGAMSRAGQERSISARARARHRATVRMSRITSSILATAIASPTSTWRAVARLVEPELGTPRDDFLAESR